MTIWHGNSESLFLCCIFLSFLPHHFLYFISLFPNIWVWKKTRLFCTLTYLWMDTAQLMIVPAPNEVPYRGSEFRVFLRDALNGQLDGLGCLTCGSGKYTTGSRRYWVKFRERCSPNANQFGEGFSTHHVSFRHVFGE